MRMRWYAAAAGIGWLAVVSILAGTSDMAAVTATLFAVIGLMVIAALTVLVTTHRLLQRVLLGVARIESSTRSGRVVAGSDDAKMIRKDLRKTFRQVEALQNLYAMVDIQHALPASRGFPASPDLLLFLVDLVDRHRPRVIVECGSGLSTLCLALALRKYGINGKVVALEHLSEYAEQSDELLRRHGVADFAEVRTAPLERVVVNGESIDWYAEAAWKDIDAVDLLFVDGPPSKLSAHARYPAIPLLYDRLAPTARIVLDDSARAKEQAVIKRWKRAYPSLSVENIPLEKGAALLTFSGDERG